MLHNTKNARLILIGGIAALTLGIVLYEHFAPQKTATKSEPVVPAATMHESCYIWNTEAGDSATLRLSSSLNDPSVSGSFFWMPANEDKKTGTFTGTITSEEETKVYTAWWKTSSKGVPRTEELRFSTDGFGRAVVMFGAMKDRGDGVYVYADPSHTTYGPWLMETDCSDTAVTRQFLQK